MLNDTKSWSHLQQVHCSCGPAMLKVSILKNKNMQYFPKSKTFRGPAKNFARTGSCEPLTQLKKLAELILLNSKNSDKFLCTKKLTKIY